MKADPKSKEIINLNVEYKIIVNTSLNKVSIRIPREIFGDSSPETWGFVAAVLSQDGFPSTGIWCVRDVLKFPEQWRLGGAPDSSNHTRIVDLVWPFDLKPSQEEMLSTFLPVNKPQNDLTIDNFARIRILIPE